MKKLLLLITPLFIFNSICFSQITVANNNNVGIGTAKDYVPSSKLEVSSENIGDAILRIEADKDDNNEADNARIELRQDGGALGVDIGFNHDNGGVEPDNLFRIRGLYSSEDKGDLLAIRLNSGNIGVGTSNPVRALHINQFTKDQGLYITEPNNSQSIALHLADNVSGEYGYLSLGGNTVIRGNGQVSYFDGNVGIGTISPKNKLQIGSAISLHDGGNEVIGFNWAHGSTGEDLDPTLYAGEIRFDPVNGNLTLGTSPSVTETPVTVMYLSKNKNVGIGVSPHINYKLNVGGKVRATSFISNTNTYADYVFEKYYQGKSKLNPDYTMPTLEEIEQFTKEHNHLPEIPSYKEVQKNGVDLGEMTNLLLQKIEELTLYTIEQNKLNKVQQQKIQQLEEKLNQLEAK